MFEVEIFKGKRISITRHFIHLNIGIPFTFENPRLEYADFGERLGAKAQD